MMYRCENCGVTFEDGDQKEWIEMHGEEWTGCPICGGGYEEVHQCKECEEWHTEDELYSGWCEKCLRETINYDTFFEYCEANKDEQYLDTFVMCEILNCEYVPKFSSEEFHQLMCRTYWERVSEIQRERKVFGTSFSEIIGACIRFIMDDDGSIGRQNYADWLNKREGK